MADITSTYSSNFYDVERRIYNLVMRLASPATISQRWSEIWISGGASELSSAAKTATEMVKVFGPIQEAFAFDKISKDAVIEWLMQLEPTPIELSEIIEEMEANKVLTYDIQKRTIVRGTGE